MKSLSNKPSVKLVSFIFNHPVLANIQLFKWATKNRYLEKRHRVYLYLTSVLS